MKKSPDITTSYLPRRKKNDKKSEKRLYFSKIRFIIKINHLKELIGMPRKKILIEIDKDLWFRFRGRAFEEGETVRALMERVIKAYLGEPDGEPEKEKPAKAPSRVKKSSRFRGGG